MSSELRNDQRDAEPPVGEEGALPLARFSTRHRERGPPPTTARPRKPGAGDSVGTATCLTAACFALVGRLEAAQDRRCRAPTASSSACCTGTLSAKISCRPLPTSARICRKPPRRMPPGDRRRLSTVRLCDRDLAALVGRLVVEAVRLHVVEAGLGDRDVAGDRRPEQRLLGLGDEVEEGGRRLVLLGRWPFSDPERGAADEASCLPLGAVVDRQHGDVPMHVGAGRAR